MQRANDGDVERGGFFKERLHLCAVLADDADVVTAGFVCPIFLHVKRTELAEAVCGEEDFICTVVCDDNLRPVHHGRGDKRQSMTTELERTALADDNLALREIRAEELLHHDERLGRRDDLRLRVCLHKDSDIGGMVRLHVLHNEVIRATAVKLRFEVLQPFHAEVGVYRIHDGNFFIEDDIGIIGHAVFYGVLSLKKVYVMVVYADIANIFCYKHVKALPYVLNVLISVYHSFRTMQMLFKDSEMPGVAQTDSV